MSKLSRYIEELLLPIIALTALGVSLADVFGLFAFVPTSRIPMLTLLLVSLVLSSLVLIQRKVAEIYEHVQCLLVQVALERIGDEVLEQIDPELLKVLKDEYFLEVIEFLQVALKEKRVPLNDMVRFRHYYISTLESYPRSTFFSTLPSTAVTFWEDKILVKATANFIGNGGKMRHIIQVKDAQELASPTLQAVATRLSQIGVLVHFVMTDTLTGDLKKNFAVESDGKIAWELHLQGGHVVSGAITTNHRVTDSYRRIFEKLHENRVHHEIQEV
ncbi:MAG TPA: hypothetical protein VNG51_13130 [Ktedonobacteraceae bacterium]|nr:hypothetical protein [Ktedonobacteraceae bacterium]